MNRLLLSTVLALGLVACGGEPSGTAPEATTAAQEPAAPQEAAAPAPAAATASVPEVASDGETIEEATSATSPIAAAVAAGTTTPTTATAAASRWKAGQHYSLLPTAQPVSVGPGQVEVTEIFWYGCGHCFTLETRLEAWSRNGKPDYVTLIRMPVIWNEVTREDARLYYTLESLGRLDELHIAVFRELHEKRSPLTVVAGNRVDTAATEKKVRAFLGSHGVSPEDFGKAYRSFAIENKLNKAENLSRRYMADHTPMAIVQGKYMTDVGMAGGFEPFFEILNDLAARERSGG